MTWIDDWHDVCRDYAEYHRYCDVEQRLVCNGGCDHDECADR